MKRCRKGSFLIVFIIIMVILILIIVLSLLAKVAWFLTAAPVIRNIIPFIIGGGVGYLVDEIIEVVSFKSESDNSMMHNFL